MAVLAVTQRSLPSSAKLQILFILTSCFFALNYADNSGKENGFCPAGATVELTNAAQNASGFFTESGDFFPREVARRFGIGGWRGCVCDIRPCLAFCPSSGEPGTGRKILVDDILDYDAIPRVYDANLKTGDAGERFSANSTPEFDFFDWDPCPNLPALILQPKADGTQAYRLLRNGSLLRPEEKGSEERLKDFRSFCIRLQENGATDGVAICVQKTPAIEAIIRYQKFLDNCRKLQGDSSNPPRVCRIRDSGLDWGMAKYIGALVSVPFLIGTLIVYSVLPEFRNIRGATIRCYLCCMIVYYVVLPAGRISDTDWNAGAVCLFLGFAIYSSFLASLLWLNAISFDIWRSFGGFESDRKNRAIQDRRKFVWYSIYAWGLTAVVTAICMGMELSSDIPDSLIRPGFRLKPCWFGTPEAEAVYFYGPIALTFVFDICFFVLICIGITKSKRILQCPVDLRDRRTAITHDDKYKQRNCLHLKLFTFVWISWTAEIISWLWEIPFWVSYFMEMINVLHGVWIFVVLVCRIEIWQLLKKRFNKVRQPAEPAVSKMFENGN